MSDVKRSSRTGRSRGSRSSGSSCRTCTGSRGRRRSRSTTRPTTRSAASTCTAARACSTRGPTWSRGTLYHEERGYGDQLLFPDPDSAAIVPWVEATGRLICDAQWYDGTPLAATPRHVFRGALEKAREMGFEPLMGSEFEFYLLNADDARAVVRRLPDLQHGPQRLRADDPASSRRCRGRRRHHHLELRVRRLAVGDQLRAGPRPGGPGQRVHLQERREGDREAGRAPRDVHEQAVGRPRRAAVATRTCRSCDASRARTRSATRATRTG